ncbi:glycoside hydrolase family 19 protein [Salmonella enterica]|uniref:glycoside hydrolase family 19 protein n=1 Tax=Salmonella sp. HY31 TaxID=3344879 RepID=UPI001D03CC6D
MLANKHGNARTLMQGETLAVLQQKSFLLDQRLEPFALVQRLQNGKPAGDLFWVSMRPEYLELDGECYVCLPDWMHSALNHGVFDDVVVPPVPLKVTVKAGDAVGFLGAQDLADEDNHPQIITTDYKAHIELLSLDEHVTDVVANVKGIKTGKQFIKLKLKRPLYLRNGEGEESTFEQMSAITRADAGKIIPRDATYPFTDKTGVTYFQIRPHTWVHQDDVEQLSQHDLAGLNFDCIKAEHTTDFTRTLDERWVIDALKSISSHFDSEKGPASAQAKMFYDSLIHNAENRRPPDPYPDKSQDELLFGALHTNQMNIPEYARRLIVKHDSDWHSTREDTRWSSVFKARDESPVVQLANGGFLDATRWMDKVPPFASQRSVWHFHPLEFLEAINPKGNCACGRDITLDELCDIAPKADKDILAQYLPAFNDGFREFGIISCREKAHFLAQCCHESGGLTLTKEIGGTRASYAPWYGRGLIQLTWQEVYTKYGAYVGEDFESDDASRNKIAQYPHCVRSAFWFYCVNKNVSKHAKNDDFNMVTALINGGFNGYNDRLKYFNRAVSVFKAEHLNILKKEANFSFEDSEIYNYRVYAYSWGRYHDPLRNESGTDKDKTEALKAYRRAVTLYERRGDAGKVTDIENKINALG